MSTNAAIARASGLGKFTGVYHHWDGYPTGLGIALWDAYHGHFAKDLPRMLAYLIDEHSAGWSTIVHKNFRYKPGWSDPCKGYPSHEGVTSEQWQEAYRKWQNSRMQARPQCFCHGGRHEEPQPIDQDSDAGLEWAYVFDVETRTMRVIYPTKNAGWKLAGNVALDGDSPDWTRIECGEEFERCHHVASYHFPEEAKDLGVSTRIYLGYEKPEFHDVIGFEIAGEFYKKGGSGGNSNYMNNSRHHPGNYPPDTWVHSMIGTNGKRSERPVAYITKDGYKPYKGVQWIYPQLPNVETVMILKGRKQEGAGRKFKNV